jgi:hypothetical protein
MAWSQPGTGKPATPTTEDLEKLFSGVPGQTQTPGWKAGSIDSRIFASPLQKPLSLQVQPGTDDPSVHQVTGQLDQGMIHQPLAGQIGALPPGKKILPNLYPNLRLQRIETSGTKVQLAELQPTPKVWPNLKMQSIPVIWPNFTLLPVKQSANASVDAAEKPDKK